MTYAATEIDPYLHSPIELYEFGQIGLKWDRYASGDSNVTYGGNEYTAIPIDRTKIEQSSDITRTGIKVKLPLTASVVDDYITDPPFQLVELTVRRFHEQDPDQEVIIIWKGRVLNFYLKGLYGELLCEQSISSMRRQILHRLYQITCPHRLYDNNCKVNESIYWADITVDSFSGLFISSTNLSTYADNYFRGGRVRITVDGMPQVRSVISHVGDTIETDLKIFNLPIGSVLQLTPGCARNISECHTKFGNTINYGGYPYIPEKNPMAGTPIW